MLCLKFHIIMLYCIIVESLSQVRRRLNGVEKERLEAATRSNAEVWIKFNIIMCLCNVKQ